MTLSAINIRELRLAYGHDVIFDHLNFTLTSGKCTCLLGVSGSGKTTLLRLIAGLLDDTAHFSGTIENSHSVAYMPQTDLLLPWLTAWDNVLIGTRLRGAPIKDVTLLAKKLFTSMKLDSAIHKYPRELSGGMRQRVALIRTLLENKQIILMDEPFSALDAITRFELQNLAAEFFKNRTVLLITHDPIEALRLADDIYVLSDKPAQAHKIAALDSAAPRALDHPDVTHYQAILYNALMQSKEKQS